MNTSQHVANEILAHVSSLGCLLFLHLLRAVQAGEALIRGLMRKVQDEEGRAVKNEHKNYITE